MNQVILNTPQDVINKIVKSENAGIYNIKIKCLGCSETNFIRYENMVVTDSKIAIGEHIFPVFKSNFKSANSIISVSSKLEFLFNITFTLATNSFI